MPTHLQMKKASYLSSDHDNLQSSVIINSLIVCLCPVFKNYSAELSGLMVTGK